MKPSRRAVLVGGGLLAALIVLGGWVLRVRQPSGVVVVLPTAPDFGETQGRLREAVATAMARADSPAGALDALKQLARLYHANGYLDEAQAAYAALEEADPDEPRWLHLHAVILAGYGDFEPAMARWRRVIELAPDYLPAHLRLAEGELKSNRPDAAAAIYAAVLRRWPDEPYAQLGLARLDFEAERWEEARRRLEPLVRQTEYRLGYDLIVSVYERLGREREAMAIRGQMKASGAFREAPDAWLDGLVEVCFDPYRIAIAAGARPDPEEARALILRAIELAPEEVSYRLQLVSHYTEQKNAPAALAALRELTEQAPDFADGWARLASLQLDFKEDAAAARTLAEGIGHCPDSPSLRLMRGSMLRRAGRFDEAMRELNISIELRPNEAPAYVELAHAQIAQGDVGAGLASLRRSLEAEPENPAALIFLAFHAISTGNRAEADGWMERVARQPRVAAEPAMRLTQAYRAKFGGEWQARD